MTNIRNGAAPANDGNRPEADGRKELRSVVAMQKSKAARAVNFETASHEALDQYGMEMLVFASPELSSVFARPSTY